MKISELQSLMAHNRASIHLLEYSVEMWKHWRNHHAQELDIESEYYCHNRVQQSKKKLAKLVALQKSLKREIKEKQEMQTERNRLNRYYTNFFALLDAAK